MFPSFDVFSTQRAMKFDPGALAFTYDHIPSEAVAKLLRYLASAKSLCNKDF